MIDLNLNQTVFVKLTKFGRDIALRDDKTRPEDLNGYSKWQLWELMGTFGQWAYLGAPLVMLRSLNKERTMKRINVDLDISMPDHEVRDRTKQMPNGDYATKICKKCGSYWQQPDGDWKTAEIVTICKECFEDRNSNNEHFI